MLDWFNSKTSGKDPKPHGVTRGLKPGMLGCSPLAALHIKGSQWICFSRLFLLIRLDGCSGSARGRNESLTRINRFVFLAQLP